MYLVPHTFDEVLTILELEDNRVVTFQTLEARGALLDGPPAAWHPLPQMTRRAFSLHSPDGLPVRIAQPC